MMNENRPRFVSMHTVFIVRNKLASAAGAAGIRSSVYLSALRVSFFHPSQESNTHIRTQTHRRVDDWNIMWSVDITVCLRDGESPRTLTEPDHLSSSARTKLDVPPKHRLACASCFLSLHKQEVTFCSSSDMDVWKLDCFVYVRYLFPPTMFTFLTIHHISIKYTDTDLKLLPNLQESLDERDIFPVCLPGMFQA